MAGLKHSQELLACTRRVSEFRQGCTLSACDWERLTLCFCALPDAGGGLRKCRLCLLHGLVLHLEQNLQKLGGVLVWEQPAGAVGEGSPAQSNSRRGMEWKLRLCGFHGAGPGFTQDEDLRQLTRAGHFGLGCILGRWPLSSHPRTSELIHANLVTSSLAVKDSTGIC